MLTKTSEYAIRALVYITQEGGSRPVLAKEIAANTGVPSNYLSKILRDLAHGGILSSTRGVGGGFKLARPSGQICLGDIVMPFEKSAHRDRCPFGNAVCSDANPCGAHTYYKPVRNAFNKLLDKTTLHAIARQTKARQGKTATKKR